MGVVLYYARLSPEQLDRLEAGPEHSRQLLSWSRSGRNRDYPGAETLYLEKAYRPITWLLSPLQRAWEAHYGRLDRDEPEGAARARVVALSAMPVDPVSQAFLGQGCDADARFEIGLGPPAVFAIEKVRSLSLALDEITPERVQRAFDADGHCLDLWGFDEREFMEDYVLPEFERVQAFYRAAAANNQLVMVIFT